MEVEWIGKRYRAGVPFKLLSSMFFFFLIGLKCHTKIGFFEAIVEICLAVLWTTLSSFGLLMGLGISTVTQQSFYCYRRINLLSVILRVSVI